MEDLNNFLKDAIASDEYTEHTVSLNEDCEFINGAFYEDFITEANVKVTFLEHDVDEPSVVWNITFTCGDKVLSKTVGLNEEAEFEWSIINPDVEEGVDPIVTPGAGLFELKISASEIVHPFSDIKIKVS